jgi:transposase InsO family protein
MGRKGAVGTRKPMPLPGGPSQRWSLDFLSDVFGRGHRFRILAVIDDFTRECLGLIADTSISGLRVARELDARLKEKLIKIGAKIVSHGRYVVFQMAEVAIPRNLFADILRLITELRLPPAMSTA